MTGQDEVAIASLKAAQRLDPQEATVREALRAIKARRRVAVVALDRALLEKANLR
jgi:hypothetical protein